MKYTVTKSIISVLGKIWMPPLICGQEIELKLYDVGNIEKPVSRETVLDWLHKNAGDFQSIIDFEADLEIDGETVFIEWLDENNQYTYFDLHEDY